VRQWISITHSSVSMTKSTDIFVESSRPFNTKKGFVSKFPGEFDQSTIEQYNSLLIEMYHSDHEKRSFIQALYKRCSDFSSGKWVEIKGTIKNPRLECGQKFAGFFNEMKQAFGVWIVSAILLLIQDIDNHSLSIKIYNPFHNISPSMKSVLLWLYN